MRPVSISVAKTLRLTLYLHIASLSMDYRVRSSSGVMQLVSLFLTVLYTHLICGHGINLNASEENIPLMLCAEKSPGHSVTSIKRTCTSWKYVMVLLYINSTHCSTRVCCSHHAPPVAEHSVGGPKLPSLIAFGALHALVFS